MAVLLRATGIRHRFGGQEHIGWLPPGAAVPLLTPVHDVVIDLEIESEGPGFLLYCVAREDSRFSSDNWFDTLEGALEKAEDFYGVSGDQWEKP